MENKTFLASSEFGRPELAATRSYLFRFVKISSKVGDVVQPSAPQSQSYAVRRFAKNFMSRTKAIFIFILWSFVLLACVFSVNVVWISAVLFDLFSLVFVSWWISVSFFCVGFLVLLRIPCSWKTRLQSLTCVTRPVCKTRCIHATLTVRLQEHVKNRHCARHKVFAESWTSPSGRRAPSTMSRGEFRSPNPVLLIL